MRKFCLLLTLAIASSLFLKAQDIAGFNFTIGTNLHVQFTNTSVLDGAGERKAYWTFGDGSSQRTAALANSEHTYANAGTYTVCLKIYRYTSSSGNDSTLTGELCKSLTLQNTTADSCSANFTDTIPATTPLTKIFTARPWHNHDKRAEEICWNFGDGHDTCISYNPALSNNYSVYHTYAQPGQYNVCVKIRYQGGCVSQYCRGVQIGDECRIDFHTEPVSASPLSRYFIADLWHLFQKKPLRICWQFGDGKDTCIQYPTTFTGPYAVSHNFPNAGQYNVCVKVLYDGGCESHNCKPIIITPPQGDSCTVKIFQISSSNNNLEKRFYALTAPNRVAERICWNFGDGTDTCINLQNPVTQQSLTIVHHFPGAGVYHVCAKVLYAGGCVATNCVEIVIRSNTNLCGGFMTDSLAGPKKVLLRGYSIMNSNDQVVSWRWTFGDGSSGAGQQVVHEYPQGGDYEVCLYIKTTLGCETRICKHVTVRGELNAPQLQLTPNPVTTTLHALFNSMFTEQVTITIRNANGVVVRTYTRSAVSGMNNWEFNMGDLPAGIYSVIVNSPHQLANALFFKQ
jgi:PKD repeat protein